MNGTALYVLKVLSDGRTLYAIGSELFNSANVIYWYLSMSM